MAGVEVRKLKTKTSYLLIYRGPDGKQVRVTARTATSLTMARKMAQAAEDQAERERLGIEPRRVERHTGDELCDRYEKDVLPNLRNRYGPKSQMRRYVRPFLQGKRLDKLTPADITGWLHSLKGKLQDSSRKELRNRLSAVLTFAVRQLKWLNTNPVDDADDIQPPVKAPRFMTPAEVFKVLKAADEWHRPAFAVALYCGLRKGELAGLKWEDVDMQEGVIYVRRSFQVPTKTKRERMVGIPPELVPFLLDQRRRSRGDYVFPARHGGPRTFWDLDKPFRAAVASSGIKKAVTLRHTRSTFGTTYRRATGDIRAVQRALGHTNIGTTARHYDGTDLAELVSQAAKLTYGATHKQLTEGSGGPSLSEEKEAVHPACIGTNETSDIGVIQRRYRLTHDKISGTWAWVESTSPDSRQESNQAPDGDSQAAHTGGGES